MGYGPTVVKVPVGRNADDELGVSYANRDSRDLWQRGSERQRRPLALLSSRSSSLNLRSCSSC
jgi:hypothetical protein